MTPRPPARKPPGKDEPPQAKSAPSARPKRLKSPTVDATRFPNVAKNHALRHALHILHATQSGLSREEATRFADEEVGPLASRPRSGGSAPLATQARRKPRSGRRAS